MRDDLPAEVNEDTVAAMLDNLRRLVAYEEQRLGSLNTRGSALAGFAGVGTAVIASDGGGGLPLGIKVLLVLAAVSLLFAAGAVVLGMFTTKPAAIQSTRQVSQYGEQAYRIVKPARVQVQMVDALIARLADLRSQNLERATWLDRAALALILAVFLASTAAAFRLFE